MQLPLSTLTQNFGIPKGVCIHAGANLCQERDEYRDAGFGPIIWIEALESIAVSAAKLLTEYKDQHVLQAVLWESSGTEITFNVASNNAESSSVFDFKWHEAIHPHIFTQTQLVLRSKTLDEVLGDFFLGEIPEISLLVLDLQGAEFQALLGSKKTLAKTSAIHVEVSTVELYAGQEKMDAVVSLLIGEGFTLVAHDLDKGAASGDALFVRDNLVGDYPCMPLPTMQHRPWLSIKQKIKFILIRAGVPARSILKIMSSLRNTFQRK
jgi:FkbM family methyltransferase